MRLLVALEENPCRGGGLYLGLGLELDWEDSGSIAVWKVDSVSTAAHSGTCKRKDSCSKPFWKTVLGLNLSFTLPWEIFSRSQVKKQPSGISVYSGVRVTPVCNL